MKEKGWKLLFEDNEILVVCKEPGMATQSGNLRTQDLVSRLRNYRSGKGENPEIYLIHRLDQPVGGILVFGKTKKAAADLSMQIQKNRMEKYYRAVVQGKTKELDHLENYLIQDKKQNRAVIAEPGNKGGKKAVLDYITCAEKNNRSLVEIKLETGRFHQIRVQMANCGHPICGDSKYNENAKEEKGFPALFAWKLQFKHPVTGKTMVFQENPNYGYFLDFYQY